MFDLVHKHKRIAQFILALIMIPFAFFGVDYYFRGCGQASARSPNSTAARSREAEFAQAIRDQQEQLRRSAQGVDPAILDNPEVRFNLVAATVARPAGGEEGHRPSFPRLERRRSSSKIAADPALSRRRPVLARRLQEPVAPGGHRRARIRGQHPARRSSPERIVDPIARSGVVPQASAVEFVNLRRAAARGRVRQYRRRGVRQGRQRRRAHRKRRSTTPMPPPSRRPRKRNSNTWC